MFANWAWISSLNSFINGVISVKSSNTFEFNLSIWIAFEVKFWIIKFSFVNIYDVFKLSLVIFNCSSSFTWAKIKGNESSSKWIVIFNAIVSKNLFFDLKLNGFFLKKLYLKSELISI